MHSMGASCHYVAAPLAREQQRSNRRERTRERVPLQWAASTGHLGVAQMALANRIGDARMAKAAVSQSELALATAREGGDAPLTEYLAAKLPKARALVEQLRKP
jgi:hypothetical protein